MELLFFGTSSGTPTKNRNVSAVAIKEPNSKNWCLVDCGEGTQHRILNTHLSLNNLQAIFITHVHGDHCYGLPGLLGSAAMNGRAKRLYIVGPPEIEQMIRSVQITTQLQLPYDLIFINVLDLQNNILETEFNIGKVELSHRVPSYAYAFTSKANSRKLDVGKLNKENIKPGPIWSELQKGINVKDQTGKLLKADEFLLDAPDPLKIIVAGDNDNPELLFDESKNANVLVHEATYTHDVLEHTIGSKHQHSSAKIVSEFAARAGIKNLVLTHFSPRYQSDTSLSPSILDIENEAKKFYPGNLLLANDLDLFKLGKDCILKRQRHL